MTLNLKQVFNLFYILYIYIAPELEAPGQANELTALHRLKRRKNTHVYLDDDDVMGFHD